MRALAALLALSIALAGCTSDPGFDSDESQNPQQTPTEPDPEPEPKEPVRTVLFDDALEVSRGAPAGANCQQMPPGAFIDGETGTNTNQGQDYDNLEVLEEHWGFNATLTVESSGEVWVLFLTDNSPIDEYHWRLNAGDIHETEVPETADGMGFTSCNDSGAKVTVEFWDTTFE